MRVTTILGLIALGALANPVAADDKGKLDAGKLVGKWSYVSGVDNGKKIDADDLNKGKVTITKDTITLQSDAGKFVIKYTLDAAKDPCQIKMEITEAPMGKGAKSTGIVALKGDELKLCYPARGGEAPTAFAAKKDSGLHYFVLKRKK